MAAINFRLEFWHRSFLTMIMVVHYPLFEFTCSKLINEKMFIMCKLLVALCYVALASPPRHQHRRCFHVFCSHRDKKRGRDKKGGKRDKKQDSPTHTTQDGATENGDDDFLDDPPVQVRTQRLIK